MSKKKRIADSEGAAPFGGACGFNEVGIDQLLADAEAMDRGTTRYPWPNGLKAKIKAEIDGMQYLQGVKDKINALVVANAGPGLFGRGPFNEGVK